MKPQYYAFRVYKDNKRQELWRIRRGLYATAPGFLITTSELEKDWESKYIVKRISKK